LCGIFHALQRILTHIHDEKKIDVIVYGMEGLSLKDELQCFKKILGNLMDNVFKWAITQVRVNGIQESPWLLIYIKNARPGVFETVLWDLIDSGRRLDESEPGWWFEALYRA
jgi:hypothetical protein